MPHKLTCQCCICKQGRKHDAKLHYRLCKNYTSDTKPTGMMHILVTKLALMDALRMPAHRTNEVEFEAPKFTVDKVERSG